MSALSVGYLVAVSLTTVLHVAARARENDREPRVRGPAAAILAAAGAILLYAVWNNSDDASLRPWSFLPRYADATLDDMDGRPWLVTPGLFDANLMLRARERGIDFHPINLADQTARSVAFYKDSLPDIGLRNTAEVGTFALLHEWLEKRDDAPDSLAFAYVPHFWQLGSFADVPSGVVFAGLRPEEASAMPLGPVAERVRGRMDALQPLFDAIPTNAHPRVLGYSGVARSQVSMADGLHPERAPDVDAAVAELAANPPEDGWALASRSGYVADPFYFARQGLSWAASGQANPALQSIGEAFDAIAPEDQGAIRRKMADLFLSSGNFAASEDAFRKILEEDPADRNAILGLFRIALFQGRFDEAKALLESARVAGVPGARILYETAVADLLAGSVDQARAIAQRLLELDPAGADARLLLANIHATEAERCDKAGDAEGRAVAVAALRRELSELARTAVADDARVLVLSARASAFEDKPADARAELLGALKAAEQSAVRARSTFDPVPLLSEVLSLDFRLADRKSGVAHAKEILRRAPDHPFANWVMGSNALEFDRAESAEAFLERVLRASPDHLYALNDLAFAKYRLRKYDEAEALARRTIELEPRWGGAWDTLGCVMLARGDAAGARDAMDNAMKLDSDNDPRYHLHYAQVLEAQGETDRARTIVRGLVRARDSFNGQDRRELDEIASRFRIRD